jgi:hypothetical protein
MTLTQLAPPYPIFTDKSGLPLDNGYLYFGTANLNPETNPITVYYDSALTQPAAQPLRTSNGYVMRNGSPAIIYANSQFSVTVRDKKKALVIYSPVGYGILPGSSATSSDQISYNEGATGASSRILTSKLQEIVSVKDFGAVGNGVTDDTVALQNAANAVAGLTGAVLLIPAGNYLFSSPLNFKEIRYIMGVGELQTKMTGSVDYVTIGTSVSSNYSMDGAEIQLFVKNTLNSGNNNTGLAGTRGIVVRGSARGRYRLYSYNAEYGIVLAPESGQYIAFSEFTIGVNGTRIGLEWAQTGTGWYNQNTFVHVDAYPQGNAISGGSIGIRMNTGTPNNNVFLHVSTEGMDEDIVILTGLSNKFQNVRNESSGGARFGDGIPQSVSGTMSPVDNNVEFIYSQSAVSWQAERPNVVYQGTRGGPIWNNQIRFSYLDFVKAGSLSGYTAIRGINSATGTPYFQFGVRDDTEMSFDPGSNHRVRYYVPVTTGDILRVNQKIGGGASGPYFTISALDASLTALPALSAGQMSYIGSDATANISGVSQLNSFLDMTNAAFEMPLMISVNRSEVKFLAFDLRASIKNIGFVVDKLLPQREATITNQNSVVGITNLASGSLAAGQIALGDLGRIGVGGGSSSIVQLGQVATSRTAAQIASITDTVNTTHKVAGLMVRDSTNNRVMMARGSAAGDPWDRADGGVSVTPT